MAGGVEALSLLVQASRVQFGIEDALLVVKRAGQIRAVRVEDRAAAATDEVDALQQPSEREVLRV